MHEVHVSAKSRDLLSANNSQYTIYHHGTMEVRDHMLTQQCIFSTL